MSHRFRNLFSLFANKTFLTENIVIVCGKDLEATINGGGVNFLDTVGNWHKDLATPNSKLL